MILKLIAAYRGWRTYKKYGYNLDLNPYKPRRVGDCWDAWHWAHHGAYCKDVDNGDDQQFL